MKSIFVMAFVIFLLPSAFAQECADEADKQIQSINTRVNELDHYIAQLTAYGISKDVAMQYAANDLPGIKLKDTLQCLYEYYSFDQSITTNNQFNNYLSSDLTIAISTTIAIILASYFISAHTIRQNIKQHHTEVTDRVLSSLDGSIDEIKIILDKDKTVYHDPEYGDIEYVNSIFDRDRLYNIISSDHFLYLKNEQQTRFINIHRKIKKHNEILQVLECFSLQTNSKHKKKNIRTKYYQVIQQLHILEKQIKEIIHNNNQSTPT